GRRGGRSRQGDPARPELRGHGEHVRADRRRGPAQLRAQPAAQLGRRSCDALASEPPGGAAMSKRAVLVGIEIAVPCLVLVTWYFLSAESTSFYFPPLADMLAQFQDTWLGQGFARDAVPSLTRMGIGYLLAVIGGVVVGV